MSIYNLVLFLHVATLLFALVVTGILHGSMWLMVRAATVAELRVSARPQQLGALFALFILALIGSGFSLLNLSKTSNKFHFSDPFAWTSVVVLVFLFLNGPLILGRHDKALRKALTGSSNGPVSPELHALTINRTVWFFEFINPFTVLGVVLNMATMVLDGVPQRFDPRLSKHAVAILERGEPALIGVGDFEFDIGLQNGTQQSAGGFDAFWDKTNPAQSDLQQFGSVQARELLP